MGPFPKEDLYIGDKMASLHIDAQAQYHILCFLLDSAAFASYPHRNDSLLAAPPPTDLLPCGPEHIVKQHILETVEVDESSYNGTDQLINKIWLDQMGLSSPEAKKHLAKEGFLHWGGDLLTVNCMDGLFHFQHDELNSFEWLEWIEPIFGRFHLTIVHANSLHSQYLGTSSGIGLRQAFELLGQKHLMKQETKRIFWHHLDEALWHIGEAIFLALWLEVSRATDLANLVSKTPQELLDTLDNIFEHHASRHALEAMDHLLPKEWDPAKCQMTMLTCDLLPYFDLQEAMQIGDVSRMEDLLLTLLFHFIGGENHKYTVEILELLHKLCCEWPEDVR